MPLHIAGVSDLLTTFGALMLVAGALYSTYWLGKRKMLPLQQQAEAQLDKTTADLLTRQELRITYLQQDNARLTPRVTDCEKQLVGLQADVASLRDERALLYARLAHREIELEEAHKEIERLKRRPRQGDDPPYSGVQRRGSEASQGDAENEAPS